MDSMSSSMTMPQHYELKNFVWRNRKILTLAASCFFHISPFVKLGKTRTQHLTSNISKFRISRPIRTSLNIQSLSRLDCWLPDKSVDQDQEFQSARQHGKRPPEPGSLVAERPLIVFNIENRPTLNTVNPPRMKDPPLCAVGALLVGRALWYLDVSTKISLK